MDRKLEKDGMVVQVQIEFENLSTRNSTGTLKKSADNLKQK
jgi:hypothetical protein